jgi:hypothetical protein
MNKEIQDLLEQIKTLTTERDEARHEAYRYWLILQCQLEADLGSITESKRLAKIYSDEFSGNYFDHCSSEDPPPYGFKSK